MAKPRFKTSCALLVAGLALLASSTALADPGDGIRSGNLKLEPTVTLGLGYEYNIFFQAPSEGDPVGAPTLQLIPELRISTIEPRDFAFQARANAGGELYLPVGVDESVQDAVFAQSGFTYNVVTAGTYNPLGNYSLRLEGLARRTNEPPAFPIDDAINQSIFMVGPIFGIHPGGRVLEIYAGYHLQYTTWDLFRTFDNLVHDFDLNVNYKLLPKTTLLFTADFNIIRYPSEELDFIVGPGTSDLPNYDSMPLRLLAGVNTLITRSFRLRALIGYGNSFHEAPPSFGDPSHSIPVIGQLELGHYIGNPARGSEVFLGYQRDFADSPLGNYFAFHQIYGGYTQKLGPDDDWNLTLRLDFTNREYAFPDSWGNQVGVTNPNDPSGPALQVDIPENLNDNILALVAGTSYAVNNWWSVGGRAGYNANFPTDSFDLSGGVGGNTSRRYNKFFAELITTFRY